MNRILFALSTLALVATGCGVAQELYDARVNELNKARAEMDEQDKLAAAQRKKSAARIAELEKERDALKARLTALGADVEKGQADLEAMKKRVEELKKAQEQAELRAKTFRDLVAKFRSMVESGKLKVEIRNGLMLVKLADNILFDPGKTDLKKEGKEAIKEVSQILAGIEGRKFQVTGHTDNVPIRSKRFKSNWELSAARAVEVVNVLIAGGMPAPRLSAAGYADVLPVATNDTDDGRKHFAPVVCFKDEPSQPLYREPLLGEHDDLLKADAPANRFVAD